MKHGKILKFAKWGLAILALIAIPIGGYFYKWNYADKDIPLPVTHFGESYAGEDYEDLNVLFLDELLAAHKTAKVPAISAAVYITGNLAWAGTQGFANIEENEKATLAHKFRLGSTSKPLVSTLALLMSERGKVDIDEPISTYISDLPETYGQLTLRRLLSHTGGVRNYGINFSFLPPHEGAIDTQYSVAKEALSIFIDDPLVFSPGEGFKYSAWGFVLASAVLEAAGGKPFPTLLKEELLDPLEINDIAFEFAGQDETPKVGFYLTNKGKYTSAYPLNTSIKWAAAGAIATPMALAEFGSKLLAGDILGEKSLETLWTPIHLSDGSMNEQFYALGFRENTVTWLLGEDQPTQMVHHGGVIDGGSSFLIIIPEHDVVVSVQANAKEPAAREAVEILAYKLIRVAIQSKQNDGAK